MPIWSPKTPEEEELRPIDVLYGCYDPKRRSIDIFVNRINQDANTFCAEAAELLQVVRLHERAHAVVHLGIRADDIEKPLSSFGGDNRTAWSPFLDKRTSWFATFPTELHEFLAQALTYAALSESERLRKVFEALEAKQPEHYKLSAKVKKCAAKSNWPLILDVARDEDVMGHREPEIGIMAALEALICSVD